MIDIQTVACFNTRSPILHLFIPFECQIHNIQGSCLHRVWEHFCRQSETRVKAFRQPERRRYAAHNVTLTAGCLRQNTY